MRDAEDVRKRAIEAGFAEIAEDLVRLARPALVLDSNPSGQPVGRLGGLPRLPSGVRWPHTRRPGATPEPLAFFGEVELAALDRSVWPGPRTGVLSFFCQVHADATYTATRSGTVSPREVLRRIAQERQREIARATAARARGASVSQAGGRGRGWLSRLRAASPARSTAPAS